MPYYIRNSQYAIAIAIVLSMLFAATKLYAQDSVVQRSYTAPSERHLWVPLYVSLNSSFEYDRKSIVRVDSQFIRVLIKETPLPRKYYDVKVTKMWEQRSIQGYSDSLEVQPIFYYEGYERYGFTVYEEEINLYCEEYTILAATDYNLAGRLLGKSEIINFNARKSIDKTGPERNLWNSFIPNVKLISITK